MGVRAYGGSGWFAVAVTGRPRPDYGAVAGGADVKLPQSAEQYRIAMKIEE